MTYVDPSGPISNWYHQKGIGKTIGLTRLSILASIVSAVFPYHSQNLKTYGLIYLAAAGQRVAMVMVLAYLISLLLMFTSKAWLYYLSGIILLSTIILAFISMNQFFPYPDYNFAGETLLNFWMAFHIFIPMITLLNFLAIYVFKNKSKFKQPVKKIDRAWNSKK